MLPRLPARCRRYELQLDVAVAQAALGEVLLVVILGAVESLCGDDLGNDRTFEVWLRGFF